MHKKRRVREILGISLTRLFSVVRFRVLRFARDRADLPGLSSLQVKLPFLFLRELFIRNKFLHLYPSFGFTEYHIRGDIARGDLRFGIFDDLRSGIFDDLRSGIFDDLRSGIFVCSVFFDYTVANSAS